MKIYRFNYQNTPLLSENISLCLGFFDGVHIGHKTLIEKAKEQNKPVGVLTFSSSFKRNDKSLTTIEDKIDILTKLNIDYLFIVENTFELANLSAIDFINFVLKKINPSLVIVGSDFRFGHFGKGNPDILKDYFQTIVLDLLPLGDKKISSSWIRNLIEEGDIDLANQLLGRPYKITSRIVSGKGNGSSVLKFPTINLQIGEYTIPKNGVYFVRMHINNTIYNGIANVGFHPTIDELFDPIIEIYLKDKIDLSSGGGSVEFLHFLRNEKRFENIELLKSQIASDIDEMDKYFENNKK